jgi:hypothetical protein
MRKMGWALIGISALMAGNMQVANAWALCTQIHDMCPGPVDGDQGRDGQPTSVPEPATLMLLGAGVTAVGAAALRRRKNKDDK